MQEWLFQHVPLLAVIRILAVVTAFPVMAGPTTPRSIRIYIGLALGIALLPSVQHAAPGGLSAMATLLAAPMEVLIGLSIGYSFSLIFHVLAITGDFAGQEMGLNAASQIDPITGRSVPLLARMLETVGLVLFVELGGLALLLRTIKFTFEAVPPGSFMNPIGLSGTLAEACTTAVSTGVLVAMPAGVVLLLLTMFTTVTARTLPKLHIFDFAFATRIMAAIFLVSLLLPRVIPALEIYTTEIIDRLHYAFQVK